MKYYIKPSHTIDNAFFITNKKGKQLTGAMAFEEATELIKQWTKMDKSYKSLPSFLRTDLGYVMWNSPEVHLVLNGQTIFQLRYNYEIVQDDLGLIDPNTNGFTDKAYQFKVESVYTHADVNYILLKEVEDEEDED